MLDLSEDEETEDSAFSLEPWFCPRCTFHNPQFVMTCGACETAHPLSRRIELASARHATQAAQLAIKKQAAKSTKQRLLEDFAADFIESEDEFTDPSTRRYYKTPVTCQLSLPRELMLYLLSYCGSCKISLRQLRSVSLSFLGIAEAPALWARNPAQCLLKSADESGEVGTENKHALPHVARITGAGGLQAAAFAYGEYFFWQRQRALKTEMVLRWESLDAGWLWVEAALHRLLWECMAQRALQVGHTAQFLDSENQRRFAGTVRKLLRQVFY